jgi:hydrogenase maturation factor
MTTLYLDPDDRELLRAAVAALQTIAAALSATLSDDLAATDTHAPASADGDTWLPRAGERAIFTNDPVVVKRLFFSEGMIAALVAFKDGSTLTTWASALSEPPA